jgi:HTH-type transcriptional regulator, glycine betaine synthesis regulator
MADPEPSSLAETTLHRAQDELAEVFGNIAAFWGFTRTQGRVFGLLFLSPAPLGHAEIRERLAASAGSVSMTLTSLQHWGVVRRDGRLFVAETDFWKIITGVMRRRERAQVDDAIDRVAKIIAALEAIDDPPPAIEFARARMVQLHGFFELGRRFLDAFVARHRISGLLSTIAHRAAKFPSLLRHWGQDVRVGS